VFIIKRHWSLTKTEIPNLLLFEKTDVRIFGTKSHEVTGVLCKLHRVDGHDALLLPRIMRTVESRARRMKKASNTYEVFVGKPA
jgi:hypothetical protein